MINNEHFLTQLQTDVSQQLISLDKQASQHRRATFSQLICLILLLVSAMGVTIVEPLAKLNQPTVAFQQFFADPAEILLTTLMFGSFAISWVFWARDLKYQGLATQFKEIYDEHSEMIKTSAPLTDLSAHFRQQMSLAGHYNTLSNVIALAVIAGIVLYQIHPAY